MKFLVMLYAEPGAWPPEEHKIALQESIDLCHSLHAEGQYRGAARLQPVDTAKCVRVREGKQHVFDGPYAETKEQLGGYFLIDVENMDEAVAVAARIPGSRRGTAEIRPILEVSGLPKLTSVRP